MLKLIKEVSKLWPNYYKKVTEDKTEKAYELIKKDLPKALTLLNVGKERLLVASSGGQGNITAGPWFATFDDRVTTKAEEGYYLVFLFSVDMKRIILELGFATRQFTKFHGENKNTNEIIRNAAKTMQYATQEICDSFPNRMFIDKLSLEPSNLSTLPPTSKHKLQKSYEQASIYHISYEIDKLEDFPVIEDYKLFLELYQKIAVSTSVPTVDSLFSGSLEGISLSIKPKLPTVAYFKQRIPYKASSKPTSSTIGKKRVSKDAKAIGDIGEKVVLAYERNKISKSSNPHLESKIVHEEAENNRPGWDISSFNESGEPIQIEVKSTISNTINNLTMTFNEWEAAKKYKGSYHLYLVSGVTNKGAKNIEIIRDPVGFSEKGTFLLKVESYDLKLNP